MDIESLEKDNDQNISALSERIGMLRNVSCSALVAPRSGSPALPAVAASPAAPSSLQITTGIHSEAEAHHSILDRMVRHVWGV